MIYTIPFSVAIARVSPIQQPRRDLVANGGDNFRLAVTIYESESDSEPMDLEGYTAYLRIYRCETGWRDDYGWPIQASYALTCIEAEIEDGIANFDFGPGLDWCFSTGRYLYNIALVNSDADPDEAAVICKGVMNLSGGSYQNTPDALSLDDGEALLLEDP